MSSIQIPSIPTFIPSQEIGVPSSQKKDIDKEERVKQAFLEQRLDWLLGDKEMRESVKADATVREAVLDFFRGSGSKGRYGERFA